MLKTIAHGPKIKKERKNNSEVSWVWSVGAHSLLGDTIPVGGVSLQLD
jgi:hypothetical protein